MSSESPPAPLVSVIIPVRNGASHIDNCLAHIGSQDYPSDRIEVIVVDGASEDQTRRRAEEAVRKLPICRVDVVANPAATTPSNLNVGLALATGTYVARVDVRSSVPPDYISRCVELLETDSGIRVVGGRQVAVADTTSVVHRGIARSFNLPGPSRHRGSQQSGAASTVYLGFFRRDELVAAGGWDERFERNQDFELNRRLGQTGVVWFEATLPVAYVPVPTLPELWRQYLQFGRWKVRYWRLTGDRPRPGQWLLLLAPVVALALGSALVRRFGARAVMRPVLGAGFVTLLRGEPPLAVRVAAITASGVSGAAWTLGIWLELAEGDQ